MYLVIPNLTLFVCLSVLFRFLLFQDDFGNVALERVLLPSSEIAVGGDTWPAVSVLSYPTVSLLLLLPFLAAGTLGWSDPTP